MTSWPGFLPHALPLVKPLARCALGDDNAKKGSKMRACLFPDEVFSPMSMVFQRR